MKRSKGNDHATFGRVIELELAIRIECVWNFVPRNVLAERVNILRPAVWQDQPLKIAMTNRLNSNQVAHLSFRPTRRRHHVRNAVDLGMIRRQVRQDAAEQMFFVECEVMGNEILAGKRPVIAADADNVSGIELAEDVLADKSDYRGIDVHEEARVTGQISALDQRAEPLLELLEHFSRKHINVP
jgi:hypothetical protein